VIYKVIGCNISVTCLSL